MVETFVVVPTYNERDNLPELIRLLLELPLNLGVIVVDDNSPDGTGEHADALALTHPDRVFVIHRSGKLGLGTAYIAGFRKALSFSEAGGSVARIMTMDADFSHHPKFIPSMVEASIAGSDLVIGSRYVKGGGTPDFPLRRRVLSSGANSFAKLMLGLRARDVTAGFRCYRREVLEALPLDTIFSSGYSFLIEMLFLVQRSGFRISEVPITFMDRVEGTSKISSQEITRAMYTVLRLTWRRIFRRRPRFLSGRGQSL